MRIQSSDVELASARLAFERRSVTESLTAWVGERPAARNGAPLADRLEISNRRPQDPPNATERECQRSGGLEDERQVEPRLRVFVFLLEKLFGTKVRMRDLKDLDLDDDELAGKAARAAQAMGSGREGRVGWGLEYEYHELREKLQHVEFAAEGVVNTADGRQIGFQLGLELTSYERSETRLAVLAGDAVKKDPLVLNFAGPAAQLTDSTFEFDLDADGTADEVAFVGSGSGFLVFDRNADGVVNDGRELFGPATGNGFAELAAYDADGNGWIDEADPVFDELAVWTRDAAGADTLTGLLAAGVGAIYLRSAPTLFEQDRGEIVSTGVFLRENGPAGTVQQVNLYV